MKIPNVYTPYHWREEHFDAEPNARRRKAFRIIASRDDGRISWNGGYPSEMCFIGSLIVVATIDGSREPALIAKPLTVFLSECKEDGEE